MIFVIIFSLIFGSGGNKTKDLYQIAATQQDIIDLTQLGMTNSQNQQIINQAATTELVLTTESNDLNAYLSKAGSKKLDNKIVPYRDTQYTKTLENALSAGTYDNSYQSIYADFIGTYRTKLQTAYKDSNNKTLKTQLANDYAQSNAFVASSD
jgi:hypothetical protein